MSTVKNTTTKALSWLQQNLLELWAGLAIFVGLPLVAWLYFDYRAAILVFVVSSIVIAVLAVRNK